MNTAQKEKIILMRTQGIGFSEIASNVNLSRDTVKSFCMRNKITVINSDDKCRFCGNPLVQKEKVKKKLFCCNKCRLDWWHKNPDKLSRKATYSFVCAGCGKPFTAYWSPVEGAEGYIVRWGIRKEERNTHWQVIGDNKAHIRCLTAGVGYYVSVDAYNKGGLTRGKEIQTV